MKFLLFAVFFIPLSIGAVNHEEQSQEKIAQVGQIKTDNSKTINAPSHSGVFEGLRKNLTESAQESKKPKLLQDLTFKNIIILRAGYNFANSAIGIDNKYMSGNGVFADIGIQMYYHKINDNIAFIFDTFLAYSYVGIRRSSPEYKLELDHLILNLYNFGFQFTGNIFEAKRRADLYFIFGIADFLGRATIYSETHLSKSIQNFYFLYGFGFNIYYKENIGLNFEYMQTSETEFSSKYNTTVTIAPINLVKLGVFYRF
jgi:opacity protein-like surface antigen